MLIVCKRILLNNNETQSSDISAKKLFMTKYFALLFCKRKSHGVINKRKSSSLFNTF